MSLKTLKLLAIALPPLLIGGFEYFRHEFLLDFLSMEAGNFYITVLSLLLSYLFANWMFRRIEHINASLNAEQAKRAVFEERERLAGELHDNLAQTLFFLNVKLKQGQIEDAKEAVSEIDNHLRQAIFNLRTAPDEGSSLQVRLRKWLENWRGMTGIGLSIDLDVEEGFFSSRDEVLLFGIVQEAFTNIRKHSKATNASIELRADHAHWSMHIGDNGCGMQKDGTSNRYGVALMSKRAEQFGAAMELTSLDGKGTTLLITGERKNSR